MLIAGLQNVIVHEYFRIQPIWIVEILDAELAPGLPTYATGSSDGERAPSPARPSAVASADELVGEGGR